MSKYEKLWKYLSETCTSVLTLSFDKVKDICGFEIDHSFLKFKKELADFGLEIDKISLKDKIFTVRRLKYDK